MQKACLCARSPSAARQRMHKELAVYPPAARLACGQRLPDTASRK